MAVLRAKAEATSLMGGALQYMDRLEEALDCFDHELHFAQTACEPIRQAQALANISNVYKKMGQEMLAKQFLLKSRQLYKERDGLEGFVSFDCAFK